MIYVDPPRRYRRKGFKWSHVCSLDSKALREWGQRLGLTRWDTRPYPHWDVTEGEYRRVVEAGAIPLSGKDLVRKMRGVT